jgi:glycosyltransferase involved in cell wall biosynthesis
MEYFYQEYLQEPKARLLLIGDGELKEQVMEQVSALGLDLAVLFLGVRGDVDELMQAMDVFVLPSRYEGLPVVGVEAQAAGLPVLCSDAVPKEAFATDNIAALSLSVPVQIWADQILKSTEINERSHTLSQIQAANYDISKTAQLLEEYYLNVF